MFVRGEQRYRDPAGSHDGVTRVRVHRARAGRKSSVLVEARGDRLMLVPPPFEPDVAVELTAPTGACWRADYRAGKNDAAGFTARGGLERPCHGRRCVE
jgi:hypothetical protein